ncbi:MAG: hypothetical protein HQL82_15485 [Magnetococcales bacterium]|nr:hypothetical protein [Magnetococcales bacterium]
MDLEQLRTRPLGVLLGIRSWGRIATVLNIILVLAMGWSLARLTWQWLEDAPGIPAPTLAGEQAAVPAAGDVDSGALARMTLFGGGGEVASGSSEQLPMAVDPALNLPETSLEIQLFGIIFAGDLRTGARALIRTQSAGELSYPVGAILPGGARIRDILADQVVIEREGRLETLRLPKSAMALGRVPAEPSGEQAAGQTKASEALRWLKAQMTTNPSAVLERVGVEPVYEAGLFRGFRLRNGRDPDFLAQFNLQDGDVVTEVNGINLNSPLKGMEAMGALASARTLHMSVMRDGHSHDFHFALD